MDNASDATDKELTLTKETVTLDAQDAVVRVSSPPQLTSQSGNLNVQSNRFKATPIHRYIPVGITVPAQLLGFQANRKAIILTPSTGANYTVSWDPRVTNGQGMTLTNAVSPMLITDEDIGSAITLPLYAIASTTGRVIAVIEILYDEVSANIFDSTDDMPSKPIEENIEASQPVATTKSRRKMRGIQ
jgi:hypothetical protein